MKSKVIANQAIEIAKRQSGEWDEFLAQVHKSGGEAEFLEYRQKVAEVMGTIFIEFINPVSQRFPSLKPEWMNPGHWEKKSDSSK